MYELRSEHRETVQLKATDAQSALDEAFAIAPMGEYQLYKDGVCEYNLAKFWTHGRTFDETPVIINSP